MKELLETRQISALTEIAVRHLHRHPLGLAPGVFVAEYEFETPPEGNLPNRVRLTGDRSDSTIRIEVLTAVTRSWGQDTQWVLAYHGPLDSVEFSADRPDDSVPF